MPPVGAGSSPGTQTGRVRKQGDRQETEAANRLPWSLVGLAQSATSCSRVGSRGDAEPALAQALHGRDAKFIIHISLFFKKYIFRERKQEGERKTSM